MSAVPYVCLPGASFCGSTLLAFLLNSHSRIASIGAAVGLVPRAAAADYRCTCTRLLSACPFWAEVARRMGEGGFPLRPDSVRWPTRFEVSRHRLVNGPLVRSLRSAPLDILRDATLLSWGPLRRRLDRAGAYSRELARAVLAAAAKGVFVDSSRDPMRVRYLAASPGIDLRAIHLVRDVRGNAASLMRHYGIADAGRAARIWRRANLEAERVRHRLPAGRWLRVLYTDLCRDLEGTLASLHGFLGLEPEPPPPNFRHAESHILGNPMRLSGAGEVREDLSWQTLLSAVDLRAIARVAGSANRAFGYNWPPVSDRGAGPGGPPRAEDRR